jgi:hypothetical protein
VKKTPEYQEIAEEVEKLLNEMKQHAFWKKNDTLEDSFWLDFEFMISSVLLLFDGLSKMKFWKSLTVLLLFLIDTLFILWELMTEGQLCFALNERKAGTMWNLSLFLQKLCHEKWIFEQIILFFDLLRILLSYREGDLQTLVEVGRGCLISFITNCLK